MKLTETEANETKENDDNDYNGNETNQMGSGEPTGLNNVTFLAKTTTVMNHRIDFFKNQNNCETYQRILCCCLRATKWPILR